MRDVNKVILIGRLGADPIQRFTKTGKSVVQFSVATSRKTYKEKIQTSQTEQSTPSAIHEETQWHRVIAWGRQGEVCAQYLKKGQQVFVEGYLKTQAFEGKDGQSKLSVEIQADNVCFLGSKPGPTIQAQNTASLSTESFLESEAIL